MLVIIEIHVLMYDDTAGALVVNGTLVQAHGFVVIHDDQYHHVVKIIHDVNGDRLKLHDLVEMNTHEHIIVVEFV